MKAMSMDFFNPGRRSLIVNAPGVMFAGALTALVAPSVALGKESTKKNDDPEEAVTPPEDLMREHGVLDRVLLIYQAVLRNFDTKHDFDPVVLTQSAEIVRDFIENYHEKSEEEQVFPRFRKAGKMVDLVETLLAQHQAGRRVTATIIKLASNNPADGADRQALKKSMQSFIAMYRPHAAREDTDLFPKLRELVSAHEYDAMAEDFEKKEHQLFGDDGFEKMVDRVAKLEEAHWHSRFEPLHAVLIIS